MADMTSLTWLPAGALEGGQLKLISNSSPQSLGGSVGSGVLVGFGVDDAVGVGVGSGSFEVIVQLADSVCKHGGSPLVTSTLYFCFSPAAG